MFTIPGTVRDIEIIFLQSYCFLSPLYCFQLVIECVDFIINIIFPWFKSNKDYIFIIYRLYFPRDAKVSGGRLSKSWGQLDIVYNDVYSIYIINEYDDYFPIIDYPLLACYTVKSM